ncbi:GDP-mannose 4,6-dehydratase, partial [Bacteroidota bacterium]
MFKKVLITGAAGFIGSHLTNKLLLEGKTVIGLDNFDNFYDRRIKEANIEFALSHNDFKLIDGDIRDKKILNDIFSGNDIGLVIHLAAKAGVRPSILKPELYYDVNVNGTLIILETMKQNGTKKLIFASSSSVYGNNNKVPFSENDNTDFQISPYAVTKKACELINYTYHKLYNFDIYNLRFFTVYGPRQRPDLAITKFTDLILKGKPIPVY